MIQALLVVGLSFFNPQVPIDSLGTQTIDGKLFIIHKVGEKETVYGISRRYGTTVDEIIKYNPTADAGLEIGQILKVPYVSRTASRPVTTSGGTHTVEAGETLYSLSRTFNASVDDLKQWNNLTSNEISLGQVLVVRKGATATYTPPSSSGSTASSPVQATATTKGVHAVEAGETIYSIARKYNVTMPDIRKWNNLEGNDLSLGQPLFITAPSKDSSEGNTVITSTPKQNDIPIKPTVVPVKETPVATTKIKITEGPRDSDEVTGSGLAELIEGTEGNRKYLALHRTAPIGTILKVRNEMNNREVFVRVMGKLPDTAMTDKLIIKISKSAYDRLGAIDPRFRVEVTYYK